MRLATRLPAPRLDGIEPVAAVPAPAPAPSRVPAPSAVPAADPPAGEPIAPADALLPDPMRAYFDTMDRFIETQQRLVSRFLRDPGKPPS